MTDVVTYQLESYPNQINENMKAKRWLAYIVLPDGTLWGVRFEGETQEQVSQNAITFYEAEKAKQQRIYGEMAPFEAKQSNEMPRTDGRGAHFIGKAWLVNHTTKQKIRVDASEVNKYLDAGWVKGGPRTQV